MTGRLKLSGEFLLALGIIALGLFFALQTSAIEVSPSYARVGPRVFPWAVSVTLIALGLWLARDAWTGRWAGEDAATAPAFDWKTFGLIGAGLAAHMILIGRAGFVIASTVLFVSIASAFGHRRVLRSTAIGLILAVIVFVGFTRGLGLSLPAGLLSGIL